MRKLVLILLVFSMSLQAQEKLSEKEKERREKNIQSGNPFKNFGYKAKVATLSNGKYLEFHDLDSIVTIGTVRWHVYKNEIVGRIVQDSLNPDAQPIGDRVGRWISPDPLSEEFPSWSPYNMCYDNPVKFVDPDGRAVDNEYDWNLTTGKTTLVSTIGGDQTDYINVVVNGKKDFTFTKNVTNTVTNIQNDSEIGSSFTERGPGYKKTTNILPTSGAGQDPTAEIFGAWAGGEIAGLALGAVWKGISGFLAKQSSEIFSDGAIKYTKSSLELGQKMHKSYKVGVDGIKEFRLPSAKRIDFLDINNSTIYELKPFNPRAMKAGQNQLKTYMKELESMPEFKGINWKQKLDTY